MKRHTKKMAMSAVYISLVSIITVAFIASFVNQTNTLFETRTYETLNISARHQNEMFKEKLNSEMAGLKAIAAEIEIIDASKENVIKIMKTAVNKKAENTDVFISDKEGRCLSSNGTTFDYPDKNILSTLLSGQNAYSETYYSSIKKDKVLLMATPIFSGKNVVGSITKRYSSIDAEKIFLDNQKNESSYNIITTDKGEVMLVSVNEDKAFENKNIFTLLEKVDFENNFRLENLKNAMKNNDEATFEIAYDKQHWYISFCPVGVNNWYSFSIINDMPLSGEKFATNELLVKTILKVLAIVFMILLYILYIKREKAAEISLANRKYQDLIKNVEGGIATFKLGENERNMRFYFVSNAFSKMTGYSRDELNTLFAESENGYIYPDDTMFLSIDYIQQATKKKRYELQYRIIKKNKEIMWVIDKGVVISRDDGETFIQSIITDITALKKQEKELLQSEERLRVATEQSNCAIFDYDTVSQRCLSLVNAKSVFGVEESLVTTVLKQQQALSLEETVKANFHPDDLSNGIEAMQCLYETGRSYVEGRIRRIDGSFGWVAMSCTTLVSDTSKRILGFVSDINDLKIANETLKIEIQNDPMTGIYNKTTTVELAKELLNTSKDGLHALLVIDVDNFKGINDTLGHLFGDAVLIDISNKLKKLFRDDDIVGRIGGDEFVVFMKNVGNINVVSRKAKEICDAFKRTYTGENKEYKVSCSIGICTTETSFEYDRMFFYADKSLYQAKNSGKDGFWIYSGEEIQAPIKTRHIDRGVRSTLSMRDRVFELMYNSVDFESTVKMVLNYMCESFDASRAYVIENIDQNSGKNSFEWCADGIEPKIALRQCVNCNVDKFDEDGQYFVKNLTIQQSFIETQTPENDAIATFQVVIYNDGKATGIIGFDDCMKIRNDSEARRTEFADMAKMLGLFILKHRAEEKADFLGNICAQSHFKETNL